MEPLILYFVLFFPSLYAVPFQGTDSGIITFSLLHELGRTLTYTIPALALVWYMMSDRNGLSALREEKPTVQDALLFGIGFPSLVILGLGISFLVPLFHGYQDLTPPPKVQAPATIIGWIVLFFSCIGTGYLEESYFRFYLLKRLEYTLPRPVFRVILSTILFSVCHIYEGPWGIVNAVLAGILLSLLFIRFRSLHGIAWAHGAYNIFVYAMGNFIS